MVNSEGHHEVSGLPPEYVANFLAEYGHVPELTSTHSEDLGDFGIVADTRPDEELDDLEYYGRHGYTRTAPTCDDHECFMCGDE